MEYLFIEVCLRNGALFIVLMRIDVSVSMPVGINGRVQL